MPLTIAPCVQAAAERAESLQHWQPRALAAEAEAAARGASIESLRATTAAATRSAAAAAARNAELQRLLDGHDARTTSLEAQLRAAEAAVEDRAQHADALAAALDESRAAGDEADARGRDHAADAARLADELLAQREATAAALADAQARGMPGCCTRENNATPPSASLQEYAAALADMAAQRDDAHRAALAAQAECAGLSAAVDAQVRGGRVGRPLLPGCNSLALASAVNLPGV